MGNDFFEKIISCLKAGLLAKWAEILSRRAINRHFNGALRSQERDLIKWLIKEVCNSEDMKVMYWFEWHDGKGVWEVTVKPTDLTPIKNFARGLRFKDIEDWFNLRLHYEAKLNIINDTAVCIEVCIV